MNAMLSTGISALLAAALAPPLDAHNGSVAIAVPLEGIAVDGTNFTVSTGDVELQHPFEPQFPVFIWLEVQRTGARFRGLHISKL